MHLSFSVLFSVTPCEKCILYLGLMFKTPKEWLSFVTGKKFVRSDTVAIYQFINPLLNNGLNVKVLWKGKTVSTTAEFKTIGNYTMILGDDIFTIKKVHIDKENPQPPNKDIIYTVFKGEEVRFTVL